MSTTGATFPSVGESVDRASQTAWSTPEGITADGGGTAICNTGSGSDYLIARTFGFAIPSDATIDGIEVKIEAFENAAGAETLSAQLQDESAALVGSSKTSSVNGTTPTVHTYGSSSDLWGATLTPTIINDADFGVRIWFTTGSSMFVDYVTVEVTYTETGGSTTQFLMLMGCGT